MSNIRVLVVDDSVVMRSLLTKLLSEDSMITVMDTASDGLAALNKISQIMPDLVTLDLEMPGMDGLTTLTELKKHYPKLPVIVCSSISTKGSVVTIDALLRGADDYVTKPSSNSAGDNALAVLTEALLPKIKALAHKKVSPPPSTIRFQPDKSSQQRERIEIVAIGSSTGGPNALTELISQLPASFPVPIVIVQHMPPVFTRLLAERLNIKSPLNVQEAVDGETLVAGEIRIAPGGFHMKIETQGLVAKIRLTSDPAENFCRPAVDVLFRSVAASFGKHALGVVLTGMGKDGALGSQAIAMAKGRVIIQDEASSVVWGMPGSVFELGVADKVLPLADIAPELTARVSSAITRESNHAR